LTTVNFAGGVFPSLSVLASASTTVQLNLFLPTNFTSLFGSLPKGYSSLNLATAIGYGVQFANDNSLLSANLTTSALDAAAQQLISSVGRAGALSFSAASNSFQDVQISANAQNKLTIPIQQSATYIFTAVQNNAALPNIYGKIKKILANTPALFAYASNFTTNFIVQVTAKADADFNAVFSAVNPAPKNPPANLVSLGAYWDISASAGAGAASVNAVLNYTYTNAQLTAAGATAASLRFAFYNVSSAAWELVPGNIVDAAANVVSQATTHFSQWGVYSEQATQGTSQGVSQQSSAPNTGDAQVTFICLVLFISCLLAVL